MATLLCASLSFLLDFIPFISCTLHPSPPPPSHLLIAKYCEDGVEGGDERGPGVRTNDGLMKRIINISFDVS